MSDVPTPLSGTIIYSVEVPDEVRKADKYADIAEAYAIEATDKAPAGCVIWAKYYGVWVANPGSTRWLVLHLLKRLEGR